MLVARETGAESPVGSGGPLRSRERGGALRYLLPRVEPGRQFSTTPIDRLDA
jgi:hypothetical protein